MQLSIQNSKTLIIPIKLTHCDLLNLIDKNFNYDTKRPRKTQNGYEEKCCKSFLSMLFLRSED